MDREFLSELVWKIDDINYRNKSSVLCLINSHNSSALLCIEIVGRIDIYAILIRQGSHGIKITLHVHLASSRELMAY